ncbi:glutathione S-transferase family protein [uncultured Roseobacter sp.]|uniref:glutathione S-transferase family protein n=1 Tax=uncultured Roseobacter sp. TaxID=114847 RepID=UPI002624A74B|nr:glutathione S-transferase family protein [uncultured Roseobacter sp.]
MITLVTYPATFGQFSASPFCTKVALLLDQAGATWQREDQLDPRKMPFQKLPVIRVDGEIIADSDAIRAYLESQGAAFEPGLSTLDKSTARAFIRMAEEHIYFHVVMDRWGNDAQWPIIRDTYFSMIPRVLRGLVTSRIRKQLMLGLNAQGLGRFNESQRLDRIEPDLLAIAARVDQSPFLFGDQPTAADASVGPMISAAIAMPGETLLSERIRQDPVLMPYIRRIDALLPDTAGS